MTVVIPAPGLKRNRGDVVQRGEPVQLMDERGKILGQIDHFGARGYVGPGARDGRFVTAFVDPDTLNLRATQRIDAGANQTPAHLVRRLSLDIGGIVCDRDQVCLRGASAFQKGEARGGTSCSTGAESRPSSSPSRRKLTRRTSKE